MQGSNRGVARVSLTWVIFLAVVALVAILFGYISQDDLSKARAERDLAREAQIEAEQRATEVDNARRSGADVLGFYDAEDLSQTVNVDLAQSTLADLSADFPDLPTDADTFQDVLPAIRAERKKLIDKIDSLSSNVAQLKSELQTEKDARSSDLAEKDTLITELRGNLRDEQANAEERQTELEDRLSTVEAQADELDQQKRTLERDLDEIARAAERDKGDLLAIIKSAKDKLAFTEGTAREEADAKIQSVSQALNLAWIDIGSHQRVVPGLTFTIRSADPDPTRRRTKTEGTIVEVQPGMAKLQLGALADPFDKVVPGDEVFNPLFDPTGLRYAALAGRFAGALDEQELTVVLGNMGIIVQPDLNEATDMLILGGDVMTDEYGDPLDEPVSPTDLPIYGEAEARGVSVVPFGTLRKYIQF